MRRDGRPPVAQSRHVLGQCGSITRARSSWTSLSLSPSSDWIAFNCWRSTYCRCASVISFSAFDSMRLSTRALRSHEQEPSNRFELDRQAVLFEQLLLVGRLHVEQAREQVDDPQRIVEARDERLMSGTVRGQ